jgi:hypothetical protein
MLLPSLLTLAEIETIAPNIATMTGDQDDKPDCISVSAKTYYTADCAWDCQKPDCSMISKQHMAERVSVNSH